MPQRSRLVLSLAALAVVAALGPPAFGSSRAPDSGVAVDPAAGQVRADKIGPELRDELTDASAGERVDALVVLRARPDLAPVAFDADRVTARLEATADRSQDPVVDAVVSRGDRVVNAFWLKNMLLVRAKLATLEALTTLDGVDRIIPNAELELPTEPDTGSPTALLAEESTWGLRKIGADRVQDELGLTGDGVRVAVLDTGVDIDHPDLAGKLVTDDPADPAYPGGWIAFDEAGEPVPSEPRDSQYHGTHVAGTVLGGDASGTRIGVAPDAELMAGMVIPGGSGTLAQVIAGMEWAIAPYDADGNPAGEPADIVSMSLGAEGHADEMVEPARNIYLAGAFPSFAIGNECFVGGSGSPGNVYEAAAVGATDVDDNVADFSCGEVVDRSDWIAPPSHWPASYVVPDVSAPGVDVLSAYPGGGYLSISGTSMATPHVSGAVALMLQARPELAVDDALDTLIGTSYFDDRYGAERPNTRYGWGRIDAYAAVSEVRLDSGVAGTVVDARSGEPVDGVTIRRADVDRSTHTTADGHFQQRLAPGEYTFTMSRFGYEAGSFTVEVRADEVTTVRPEIAPTPRGSVTGRVVYAPTGSTVPGATVRILDVPEDLSATTDLSGRFDIGDVPRGTYQVVASAPGLSRSEPYEVTVSRRGADRAYLVLPRAHPTERVSVSASGRQVNADAMWPDISADGRYVAYSSPASTLVDGDTNVDFDVFVTDRLTGEVERVSVSSAGEEGDAFSLSPSITADGRYVGFNSFASNLVPGDTNGQTDAFVYDRQTDTIERVSVASGGGQSNGLASPPGFSGDARYVVFNSDAPDLVDGDTNGVSDVFLHDRQTGVTELVSSGVGDAAANAQSREASISADGRYVAFHSDASNLVEDDTNGHTDVFVHDRQTGETSMVPGVQSGENREPQISADGRMVSYANRSAASGWNRQIYVYDRQTGDTQAVAHAYDGGMPDWDVDAASLSADGRTVAFYSYASNLVPNDTNRGNDVFVADLDTGVIERVSDGPGGVEGDGWSDLPAITGDGRYVAFQSRAENLVADDTDRRSDVFVHDRFRGPQARFALGGLVVQPEVPRVGRLAEVTVRLKNVGEVRGTYDAVLRVDGAVVDRSEVTLRPDRSERVTFQLRFGSPGVHTVRVGPLSIEVAVIGR